MDDKFVLARAMRGKVPELDNTYIERYIPKDILLKIIELDDKADEDGFWWGPNYVMATKTRDTNKIVIIIAQKPLGQGYHKLKAIKLDGTLITLNSSNTI